MRATPRLTLLWALVAAGGVLLAAYLWDDARFEALNPWAQGVLPVAAILGIAFGSIFFVTTWSSLAGTMRLNAGQGVIARWTVTAEEWRRFCALDAVRTRAGNVNHHRVRKDPSSGGVEVIVGRSSLLMDGVYHRLTPAGLPEMRGVSWLTADPECLVFELYYPRIRYGAGVRTSLFIPVSGRDRQAAITAFEHFRAIAPARQGLAHRYPVQTMVGGLMVTGLFAVIGALGFFLLDGRSELAVGLTLTGILGGLGALVVTVIIALAVQPWRKR